MTRTAALPPDMPVRMRQLPRDPVGRPLPFFAAEVNGVHDFRIMSPDSLVRAIREQLCWVCGQRLNRVRNSTAPRGTFVAGPMCLVNRTSAEPPAHVDCAEWSARACPFLTQPAKVRREGGLEDVELAETAGIAILRNPGVTALIDSEQWKVWRPPNGGVLFEFSRITNVNWRAEGHPASAAQVLDSIESGLPALLELAEAEDGAMPELGRRLHQALRWLGSFDTANYPRIAATLAEQP